MTFRIAHIADTHLGYRAKVASHPNGTNIRVQDGYDAFREIVNQIVAYPHKIDAVVIAGDLFHSSKPSIKDIAIAQYYLRELSKFGIPVHILAGNHDATDVRSELAASAVVDDPDRHIYSLYAPYKAHEIGDGILLHSVSHHGLTQEETPTFEVSTDSINIFTTHGAAIDPKNDALMRCLESPREQIIPTELITDEMFSAVLLGHYHSRYEVGGSGYLNTAYAGSTLRRGFSDEPGERGWWLVEVEPNGDVKFKPQNIHQRPQFDLNPIDASNLTAQEILEQMELNLEGTYPEGEDPLIELGRHKLSPIVRQRVVNAPRVIREGLNRGRISELTKHTLLWQLEFPQKAKTVKEDSEDKDNKELSFSKRIDIIEQFQTWVEEAKKDIPKEYVHVAIDDAEKLLKTALETGEAPNHAHH